MARVASRSVRVALEAHGGNISAVARSFNRSRQTVYNWIEEYDLWDDVKFDRDQMFEMAENNLFKAVQAGNIDVSKFVLTHMPTPKRWSNRTEITGADGEAMFALSPDVMALLKAMGVEPSDAHREFEAIIREQADAQRG